MNIIKRDGTEAVFDVDKIKSAVTRANNATDAMYQISEDSIQKVADSVAVQCRLLGHTPNVEEIQNLVENELMRI